MGREGRSGRVLGAGTRGGGDGATGHLAESVWVSEVFGKRRRRPLLSGLRAPPCALRGPGRKFARAARSACDPVGFVVSPGTGARGEGAVGGRRGSAGLGTALRPGPRRRRQLPPQLGLLVLVRLDRFLFLLAEIPGDRWKEERLAVARHGALRSLDCTQSPSWVA